MRTQPGAVVDHLLQPALAQRQQLGDDADVVLGHVDRQPLDRLVDACRRSRGSPPAAGRRSARSPRGASISTSTASCSSPRPWTSQASGRSVSRTRSETLPTSSWSRRARTWRAVSLEPSRPASGEVLMPTVTESDGSSTVMTGSGRGSSGSASVSPIVISAMPGDGDDLARPGLVGLDAVERLGDVELADLRALDGAVGAAPGDRLRRGGSCRGARGRARGARRRARRRGWSRGPGAGAPGRARGGGMRSSSRSSSGPRSVARLVLGRARRGRPRVACRRSGTRSAPRRRRGRGRARRPRRRPRRCARRAGRPC